LGFHAEREIHQSFDLLGNGANLAIAKTRRDDQRVKGVHQPRQVQTNDRVNATLLFGRDDPAALSNSLRSVE